MSQFRHFARQSETRNQERDVSDYLPGSTFRAPTCERDRGFGPGPSLRQYPALLKLRHSGQGSPSRRQDNSDCWHWAGGGQLGEIQFPRLESCERRKGLWPESDAQAANQGPTQRQCVARAPLLPPDAELATFDRARGVQPRRWDSAEWPAEAQRSPAEAFPWPAALSPDSYGLAPNRDSGDKAPGARQLPNHSRPYRNMCCRDYCGLKVLPA